MNLLLLLQAITSAVANYEFLEPIEIQKTHLYLYVEKKNLNNFFGYIQIHPYVKIDFNDDNQFGVIENMVASSYTFKNYSICINRDEFPIDSMVKLVFLINGVSHSENIDLEHQEEYYFKYSDKENKTTSVKIDVFPFY